MKWILHPFFYISVIKCRVFSCCSVIYRPDYSKGRGGQAFHFHPCFFADRPIKVWPDLRVDHLRGANSAGEIDDRCVIDVLTARTITPPALPPFLIHVTGFCVCTSIRKGSMYVQGGNTGICLRMYLHSTTNMNI